MIISPFVFQKLHNVHLSYKRIPFLSMLSKAVISFYLCYGAKQSSLADKHSSTLPWSDSSYQFFQGYSVKKNLIQNDIYVTNQDSRAIQYIKIIQPTPSRLKKLKKQIWVQTVQSCLSSHMLKQQVILQSYRQVDYNGFGFSVIIILPGNCNHDNKDDFMARDIGPVNSVDEFGSSWLLEGEPATCGIIKKEEMPCSLLPPEVDPCLTIMNEEIFGRVRTPCHLVAGYQTFCIPALIMLSTSSRFLFIKTACCNSLSLCLPPVL